LDKWSARFVVEGEVWWHEGELFDRTTLIAVPIGALCRCLSGPVTRVSFDPGPDVQVMALMDDVLVDEAEAGAATVEVAVAWLASAEAPPDGALPGVPQQVPPPEAPPDGALPGVPVVAAGSLPVVLVPVVAAEHAGVVSVEAATAISAEPVATATPAATATR